MLSLILVFAALAPAWAGAREIESEGEGSGPPSGPPGLEEGPEFEPGGEETELEELPPSPGEEVEGEETASEEEAPVEFEPPPPPVTPPPVEVPGPEAAPEVAPPPPPSEAPPSTPAPAYEAELAPSGEAPPAPPAVVENQPISAPPTVAGKPHPKGGKKVVRTTPKVPQPVAPPAAPLAPEPPSPLPPAMPVEPDAAAGSLQGGGLHTVRPGECLWSIATALLSPGAGNAVIAAEVVRLWALNSARIGTGDPNLILIGTKLRLG